MTAPAHKKGFTLVELIVYIGVMTLALASIVVLLTNATQIVGRIKEAKEVRASALVALERLDREIKNAGSVLTATSDTLTLQTVSAGEPATLSFSVDGNDSLILAQDGVSRGSLLSDMVRVDELEFYAINNTISESVTVELVLSHVNTPTKTERFYLTSVLRGSY